MSTMLVCTDALHAALMPTRGPETILIDSPHEIPMLPSKNIPPPCDEQAASAAGTAAEPARDLAADHRGPPRVILQPGDLLAAIPPTHCSTADVIAASARAALAQFALPAGVDANVVAKAIGANAATALAFDPIERVVAAAHALLPAGDTQVRLFADGHADVQLTVFSVERAESLATELGCGSFEPHCDGWRRAERGTGNDPIRLVILAWERPRGSTDQAPPATSERAESERAA